MFWWGKILGLLFGAMIAGFWGALFGCWVGHQLDKGFNAHIHQRHFFNFRLNRQALAKQVFFEATFTVMGCLAKADGRVSERAIQSARQVMQQMQLTARQKRAAIAFFAEGKDLNFDLDNMLTKLLRTCEPYPYLLRQFIELQLQVIYASDYALSLHKQRLLQYIAQQLGFLLLNTQYTQYRYNGQQSQAHHRTANSYSNENNLSAAYAELGVSTAASNQEVKIAYRRLISRYHPDKLIARGEPSLIKSATAKTQRIKAAYEQIKAARGMV